MRGVNIPGLIYLKKKFNSEFNHNKKNCRKTLVPSCFIYNASLLVLQEAHFSTQFSLFVALIISARLLANLSLTCFLVIGDCDYFYAHFKFAILQAPVFRRLDNPIHWIKLYPVDNTQCFAITYPLDSVIRLLHNWAQYFYLLHLHYMFHHDPQQGQLHHRLLGSA